jgi:hypothetical protein
MMRGMTTSLSFSVILVETASSMSMLSHSVTPIAYRSDSTFAQAIFPYKQKPVFRISETGFLTIFYKDFAREMGICSVAEPHHFYAALAPGENFDAAPALAAPTLLYSKTKFLKRT